MADMARDEALGEILWSPGESRVASSNLAAFARSCGLDPFDYAELHEWSLRQPGAFWSQVWDFVGIQGTKGPVSVLGGADIADTRFFPGAELNYCENALGAPDERTAIIAHRDDGTRRELSRRQLHELVSRIVQALRNDGIVAGDRVAGLVTNDIEAVAIYLACAAIGAIWASCSPDFGPAGATDRLSQIEPTIIVAVAGYSYAGKQIDTMETVAALAATPSVRRVILLSEIAQLPPGPFVRFEDWIAPYPAAPIAYHRQVFDVPLAILFSSGTTGKPKGIIHRAGGLLLKHKLEQVLHCDLKPTDRLFYYTTCGWMMWNWLVSGLASGAAIVTYDGNPAFPKADRLADIIDAEGVTVFGTSAKYIDNAAKTGIAPKGTHRLDSLRTILSTGSPLLPQNFDYIYECWKADVHLASISGGTDICGCFVAGVPGLPVRRGEMQGAVLGMDVRAFDDAGEAVVGRPGELVCASAHPSMPIGFWNDDDGKRYRAAYFERFPGVWAHGDFIERRPSGGFVIHGRSDTTLNPGGVRIGTAEIYRQVEMIPEILEAIAVGQEWKGDQRVILFVRLREGERLTGEMEKTIRSRIRSGATPRHVPAKIIAVPDIPRTRSGKISETAVRATIHGRPVDNSFALLNPECLAHYSGLAELSEQ